MVVGVGCSSGNYSRNAPFETVVATTGVCGGGGGGGGGACCSVTAKCVCVCVSLCMSMCTVYVYILYICMYEEDPGGDMWCAAFRATKRVCGTEQR